MDSVVLSVQNKSTESMKPKFSNYTRFVGCQMLLLIPDKYLKKPSNNATFIQIK
jgi:hypothetical protein